MALDTNITANGTLYTFTQWTAVGSVRTDLSSDISHPGTLEIRHQKTKASKAGSPATQRHLLQVVRPLFTGMDARYAGSVIVNVTVTIPEGVPGATGVADTTLADAISALSAGRAYATGNLDTALTSELYHGAA